jgi:DNA-binding transcriptional regulator YhcF (GntR family)
MTVAVDSTDSTPPYEQIRIQYAVLITEGRLAVGTRLPTVRQLAAELGLAANTVARSYRELEAAGLVETRGRAGTVVSAHGDSARMSVLDEARRYAELARSVGIDREEALRIVAAALAG